MIRTRLHLKPGQRGAKKLTLKFGDKLVGVRFLYDDKAGVLSIVTADPDNDAALHEVKLAARVKDVLPENLAHRKSASPVNLAPSRAMSPRKMA